MRVNDYGKKDDDEVDGGDDDDGGDDGDHDDCTAVSAVLAVSALDGCLSLFSCFAQGIRGSVHYYGRPACQAGASHPAARGDASTNRRYFHKGVDGCISLFSCISFGRLYQPLGCISLSDGCIGLLAVSACFSGGGGGEREGSLYMKPHLGLEQSMRFRYRGMG